MRKYLSFVVGVTITIILAGCSSEKEKLTISDAKEAGFKPIEQQLYPMVGAEDGWGGTWAGDTVELYQYENEAKASENAKNSFATSADPGNISGWVEVCQVRNMVMLSKGTEASDELRDLASKK